MLEKGAVETIDDIYGLVSRSKILKLEAASPEQQKQLNDFLEEHSKVAAERDQAKVEASFFASEFDRLEGEVKKLEWRCKESQGRLDARGQNGIAVLPHIITALLRTRRQPCCQPKSLLLWWRCWLVGAASEPLWLRVVGGRCLPAY